MVAKSYHAGMWPLQPNALLAPLALLEPIAPLPPVVLPGPDA